jgi:hypothetical protein
MRISLRIPLFFVAVAIAAFALTAAAVSNT